MTQTMTAWEATEKGAELAAKFLSTDRQPVIEALRAMSPAEAASVAIFIGGYLSPSLRFRIVDMLLEVK